MTFNSGPMRPVPPEVSTTRISTDAYDEPVEYTDAEICDEDERDACDGEC